MEFIWNLIVYATIFLNILIISKSLYNKNLYGFIFFSAWFVIYSVQQIFLLVDLGALESVKYLNVTVNREGFKIASIVHLCLLFLFLSINQKVGRNIATLETCFYCGLRCKLIYSILFFSVLFIFLYKSGGLSDLVFKSRPANVSGLTMFIAFFSGTKLFLMATYSGRFDRYFLFLYVITLIVFAMTSRLHLLMSMIAVFSFLWIYKIRNHGINLFGFKALAYIALMPLIFLFLGFIKFRDGSLNAILDQGYFNYFYSTFGSLAQYLKKIYMIGIEGFSNFGAFFSENKLMYHPTLLISHLDFFVYLLPSFLRSYMGDFTNFVNSFSNVKGNVPPVFTYMLDSFHLMGILIMFILIYFVFRALRLAFRAKGVLFFLVIIFLNNSLLLIRGTPEIFIAFICYELASLFLLYIFSVKIRSGGKLPETVNT